MRRFTKLSHSEGRLGYRDMGGSATYREQPPMVLPIPKIRIIVNKTGRLRTMKSANTEIFCGGRMITNKGERSLSRHHIRHYGLFASTNRTETMEAVRKLLDLAPSAAERTSGTDPGQPLAHSCPHCGGRMVIIETFEAGCQPRHQPTTPLMVIRIDTS